MAARTASILKLSSETWGDTIHRAYRTARSQYGRRRDPETGEAKFSYRTVAAKLQAAGIDASDQSLMRLEELDEMPTRMRQRQLAYWVLVAYGYDPEDFGLTADIVSLDAFNVPKIKRVLAPTFSWSPRPTTGRKVHETPGHTRFLMRQAS